MAGFVPATHVFLAEGPQEKPGMPATSAGMTAGRWFDLIEALSSANHLPGILSSTPFT
jgi:hypothetical protein